MITITIPAHEEMELWDPAKEEFVYFPATKCTTLTLEHSLISISKWEAKWKKAFLKDNNKTAEEILDYIRCMTLEKNIDPAVYEYIPDDELSRIRDYIEDPMTASHVNTNKPGQNKQPPRKEVVTSELIYYWMIANEIPFECEKWHINRLLMLIQICSVKNSSGGGKFNKRDLLKRNNALNAARRAKSGSKG